MGIDAEMFAYVPRETVASDVLSLAYDLAEAFGPERFLIAQPGKYPWWPDGHHAITVANEEDVAASSIEAREGWTLLCIQLRGRYWGMDDGRGDLPFMLMVARWIEHRCPEAELWYGGDSCGIEPLTAQKRAEMWARFCKVGHKPYRNYRLDTEYKRDCPLCRKPLRRYGWGGRYAAMYCDGCGLDLETRDGGTSWKERAQ